MKRIGLFLITNFLVVITLSIIFNLVGATTFFKELGINQASLFVFCLVWGFAGAFVSLLLSKTMAKAAYGVRIINPKTNIDWEKELVRVVHAFAQKAGIRKMPEVGVYESAEVNAFATGPTRNRSLVAVSSGLLENMDRDQIEGVLAHEVAHVANGDMVTMTLVQGIVNSFALFFSRILAQVVAAAINKERDSRGILYFVLVQVFDVILTLFGAVVVCWFSRHREFRADAGAADLVGKHKMISALDFLRTNYEHNAQLGANAPQNMKSMKIFGFRSKGFMYLFSTHPTLTSRIDALEGRN